jgi:type I restriction enzyme S subunit
MNKKTNKLIPALRFPEFVNDVEWSNEELGQLSEIVRGGSPRPIQDYFTTDINGLNWLKIADVPSDSKYITETKERVIKDALNSTREVNPGDLILSNSMSFGRPYISKITTCIHDGWIAIRKISNKTFEDYLYYFITSESSQSYFQTNAAGAAVKNLNAEIIKLLPIYLSKNKKEQQKISDCLSFLDNVITSQNQKLDTLIEHRFGLMQKLLPQEGEPIPRYRFKEFENDEEWEHKTLIETADKNAKWSFTGGPFGSNLKASDYTLSGIRIIQLQNIGDGEFNDEYKIYTSTEKANELLSCNIYSGDIIISKMGDPVGRACLIPDSLERCVMSSDGIRLVVDESKYSKYFIYSLINSKRIRGAIEKKATGSTRKRIGLDELRETELLIPKSQKEQQKIADCFLALDTLIKKQEEKIEQLKLHKKGLMQGLFPKITN